MEEEEKKEVSRRDFMKVAISAIGGAIGLSFAIPAIAYIVEPALKSGQGEGWLQLGSITKIELGVPTLFKLKIQRQTGWVTNEEELSIYILTKDGRDFIAMSNVCTHLGCRVRWIADQEKFICPCHNGIFDKEGNVLGGPPPGPLNQYKTKVENDQLFILGG
jgi:menaquinol-cytochrome c reductase iron-sulfur subunit